jgi:hypothetical protein
MYFPNLTFLGVEASRGCAGKERFRRAPVDPGPHMRVGAPAFTIGVGRIGGWRATVSERVFQQPSVRGQFAAPARRPRARRAVAVGRSLPGARSPRATGVAHSDAGGATSGCAMQPGTSAGGHFAGTPTRSLHARGAGASGDNFRMGEVGGVVLP